MRPEDLMKGDWVLLFNETPVIVDCIGNVEVYLTEPKGQHELDWRVTYEHIKPIPLTKEILEKNGFSDYAENRWVLQESKGKIRICSFADKWSVEIHNEIEKKDNLGRSDMIFYCRDWARQLYVHELQHALRLCGIDKTIVI